MWVSNEEGRSEGYSTDRGHVMANGMDRRAVRSRRLIVSAFERLLVARPFERITVSAIAQEADVDRKTFYQHFGSIDGLLAAITDGLAARVLDEVERAVPNSVEPGERERALAAFFAVLVQTISEGMERDRRYVERVPVDVLYRHLSHAFSRQIAERGLLNGVIPACEQEACLAYVLGGLFALLRCWMLEGCARTPDELARTAATLAEFGLHGMVDATLWGRGQKC